MYARPCVYLMDHDALCVVDTLGQQRYKYSVLEMHDVVVVVA